ITVNSSPTTLQEISEIPVKTANGHTIYVRDVADVRDGAIPQTNMVHVEGRRSVLMTILKDASASTPVVVAGVRAATARAIERLPQDVHDHLKVKLLFDQSVFVAAATKSVIREAV